MAYTGSLCNQLCFQMPNCFQFCHGNLQAMFPELKFQKAPSVFPAKRTLPFEKEKLFICITVTEKLLNSFCWHSHVIINSGQMHSHKIAQFRVSEGTVALFQNSLKHRDCPQAARPKGWGSSKKLLVFQHWNHSHCCTRLSSSLLLCLSWLLGTSDPEFHFKKKSELEWF